MKLSNFIVCDLIRQEDSKKHILVGVYSDTIIMKPLSKASGILLPLAFFITFRPTDETEKMPNGFKFAISFDETNTSSKDIEFQIKAEAGKNITITLSVQPLMIPFNAKKINFKSFLSYPTGESIPFDLDSIKVIVVEPPSDLPEKKKEDSSLNLPSAP
jgi:hypothetical protein